MTTNDIKNDALKIASRDNRPMLKASSHWLYDFKGEIKFAGREYQILKLKLIKECLILWKKIMTL